MNGTFERWARMLVAPVRRRSESSRASRHSAPRTTSRSATGKAKPARVSRSPAARTSIWGWMRGEGSRPSAASAARIAWRSRGRLPAPAKAARNRPSGFSARRIRASAPGRSLIMSSRPTETARSKPARVQRRQLLLRDPHHLEPALGKAIAQPGIGARARRPGRRAAPPDRAGRAIPPRRGDAARRHPPGPRPAAPGATGRGAHRREGWGRRSSPRL